MMERRNTDLDTGFEMVHIIERIEGLDFCSVLVPYFRIILNQHSAYIQSESLTFPQ